MREAIKDLLEALGGNEEPVGALYTDQAPEQCFAPEPGPPFSLDMEQRGEVDWRGMWVKFSCLMGNVWLARKKKRPACLDRERYGCVGGAFYAGFHKPQLEFVGHYISTGIPGALEGERFLPSAAAASDFFARIDPRPAPARYCVIKPLSLFQEGETPEVVAFFCRGEELAALCQLVFFATGDIEAVAAPFGAGCSNLLTWPLHYAAQGKPRAVLGGMDASCRKFYKTDELSLAMPFGLFQTVLQAWPDSFLMTKTWRGARKKVLRSRKVWGELD